MAEALGFDLRASSPEKLAEGEAIARGALREQWQKTFGARRRSEERTLTIDGPDLVVGVVWRPLDG